MKEMLRLYKVLLALHKVILLRLLTYYRYVLSSPTDV